MSLYHRKKMEKNQRPHPITETCPSLKLVLNNKIKGGHMWAALFVGSRALFDLILSVRRSVFFPA